MCIARCTAGKKLSHHCMKSVANMQEAFNHIAIASKGMTHDYQAKAGLTADFLHIHSYTYG